jgi:universal stress protein E
MAGITRILVAVKELKGKTLPAVLKAAQLARACGAELELFHGLSTPLYADFKTLGGRGLDGLEDKQRQEAVHRLEVIAQRLRRHGIPVTVSAVWDFPVHEAIIRRAQAVKADMIVVGRHEGRHSLPWLLRLTDWELVRLSPMPVLLVKSPRPYRHPAVLAAIDPGHAHAKPLELDGDILKIAGTISKAMRGTLHATHAYVPLPLTTMPMEGLTPGSVEAMQRETERRARTRFDRALRTSRIVRSRRYLVPRHPVDAIPHAARKCECDIVVMGAVARSGAKQLLIGNTAERILDDLACDILVIKPQKFRSKIASSARGARLVVAPVGATGYSIGYF